jgi:hypothetical protein
MSIEWQKYFDNESPPPAERYAVISHVTRYYDCNMESINFFRFDNNRWHTLPEAFQVNTPPTRGNERFTEGPRSKDEFLGFIKSRHFPELVDIADRVEAVAGLKYRDFTNNVIRKALKRDMPEWPWKMTPPNLKDSILDGKTIRTKAHGKRWKSRLQAEANSFFTKKEHKDLDFDVITSRYNFWRRYSLRVADTLDERGDGQNAMQRYSKIPHGYDYISNVSGSKSGSKHNRSPHPSRTFLSRYPDQSYVSDNSEVMSNGSFYPASSDKGSNLSSRSRSRVSSNNSIIHASSEKGTRLSHHSGTSHRSPRPPSSVSSPASSRQSAIFSANSGSNGLSTLASSISSGSSRHSFHSRNSADVLPSDSASIQGSERGIEYVARSAEAARGNAGLEGTKQSDYLFDKYLRETRGGSREFKHELARRRHERRHRSSQSEASGGSMVSYVTDTNNPLRVSRRVPRNEARKAYKWGGFIVPPA